VNNKQEYKHDWKEWYIYNDVGTGNWHITQTSGSQYATYYTPNANCPYGSNQWYVTVNGAWEVFQTELKIYSLYFIEKNYILGLPVLHIFCFFRPIFFSKNCFLNFTILCKKRCKKGPFFVKYKNWYKKHHFW